MCHLILMFPLVDTVDLMQISEDPICSHHPVMFNCTTNGPALAWIVNDQFYVFNKEEQINTTEEGDGFIFGFMDIKSSKFSANLTIERVLSKHNGTRITCSDGVDFEPRDVIVTGTINYSHIVSQLENGILCGLCELFKNIIIIQ